MCKAAWESWWMISSPEAMPGWPCIWFTGCCHESMAADHIAASGTSVGCRKLQVLALFSDKAMIAVDGRNRLLRAGRAVPKACTLFTRILMRQWLKSTVSARHCSWEGAWRPVTGNGNRCSSASSWAMTARIPFRERSTGIRLSWWWIRAPTPLP